MILVEKDPIKFFLFPSPPSSLPGKSSEKKNRVRHPFSVDVFVNRDSFLSLGVKTKNANCGVVARKVA